SARVVIALAAIGCASHAKAIDPISNEIGLGTILHPLQDPGQVPLPECLKDRPGFCNREHVYFFGVNGFNPMCSGNFNGLCGYVRRQGFPNAYFSQFYNSASYARKIREIRQTDPQAKIALLGFSLGANYVRSIANDLNKDGTRVDLLIYLVGDYV